jgi:hypothetical protein
MGEYSRYNQVVKRVRDRGKIDILALGGSITAGGYYLEFANSLREKSNLTVTVHNHGHGATEITCEQIMSNIYREIVIDVTDGICALLMHDGEMCSVFVLSVVLHFIQRTFYFEPISTLLHASIIVSLPIDRSTASTASNAFSGVSQYYSDLS